MNRSRLRSIALVLGLVLSVFVWRQCTRTYARMLPVHVDVLSYTADKLFAVVMSPTGLRPEGLAEYTYPSQRAREFARAFAAEQERESYRALSRLLQDYDALVSELSALRLTPDEWRAKVPELKDRRAAIVARCDEVRAALGEETRGE